MRGLEELVAEELFDGEVAAGCDFEFLETLLDGCGGDFDNVYYFLDGAAEVVHARCEDETGAADAGGATAHDHPVEAHALDEADGGFGDFGGVLPEFEFRCEAVD